MSLSKSKNVLKKKTLLVLALLVIFFALCFLDQLPY